MSRSPGALAVFVVLTLIGCSQPTHTITVGQLEQADRIEITTNGVTHVATVVDRERITFAANFINRYRDGWRDVWSGPLAPDLVITFYRGGKALGGYGIATDYLVVGLDSRPVAREDVHTLLIKLGL